MEFDESYYAANYPDYERQNPPRKLAHYRETVRRHLAPAAAAPRVLDLGCAFGNFLAALDPSWQAYGTDVSEFVVARARQTAPAARVAALRDGAIPFDERFDVITAWDVLEHIPDLERVAADLRAHLAERGVLIFVVPVYDGPLGALVDAVDRDETHVHRHARQFWLDWAAHHFELVDWWGIFRLLVPGGYYYAHFPTRALRRVAPVALIVARCKT